MRNRFLLSIKQIVTSGAVAALLSATIGAPLVVVAQTPVVTQNAGASHDARWQPWLGCWRPLNSGVAAPMRLEASEIQRPVSEQLMCVVPGATAASVEIVNFSGGTVTDRTAIVAGQTIAKTVDGCTGSEQSTWSADGHRLLMKGSFTCDGGLKRQESGIMSINVDGQWVQTQGISINGNSSVYVAQFVESGIAVEGVRGDALVERPILDGNGQRISPPREGCTGTESVTPNADRSRMIVKSDYVCANGLHRVADAEMIRDRNGEWVSVNGSTMPSGMQWLRGVAGAPVDVDDVLEVSKAVDVTVAEAWLTSRGQGFALTGKQLVHMADAGMPSRVIDMMVAMSNPQKFALSRASNTSRGDAEPRTRGGAIGANECYASNRHCYGMMGMSWLYGADRYYGWNTYGYGYGFGNGLYYGNQYGYNYGNGYWGPGYYSGNTPVIIVTQEQESRGKAVYGQGYTRGRGATAGSGSRPDTYTGGRSSGSSGASSAGTSGSGSSGASSGSSSTGSGESSGSTGRTAKPRGSGPPDAN